MNTDRRQLELTLIWMLLALDLVVGLTLLAVELSK